MLHVKVDEKLCQGTGYCQRLAPTVFTVTGRVAEVIESHPTDEHHDLMEEVATLCPTRAITY